jgi:hypothetical protein
MPAKPIHFTRHALFEMKRRAIRQADVVTAVRSPEQVLPSAKGRTIHHFRIGRGRTMLLRVVVKEEPKVYHVITAYKTTKVSKYWRNP